MLERKVVIDQIYERTRPKILARKTGPYFLKALSKNSLGVAEYSFVLPYNGLEYGTSGGKRCMHAIMSRTLRAEDIRKLADLRRKSSTTNPAKARTDVINKAEAAVGLRICSSRKSGSPCGANLLTSGRSKWGTMPAKTAPVPTKEKVARLVRREAISRLG